jgi:trans-aconitate 2-methyltransferase
MPWNPDLYNQFAAQRAMPFEDLWSHIRVRKGMRVIDLGCGTGEHTLTLAERLPESTVVGLDSSPDMIERARRYERDGLTFVLGDLARDDGQTWDLVFSHAAVQWVQDHPTLIPSLLRRVAPGGQIAVQMPSNHHHAVHHAAHDLARSAPYREALDGYVRPVPVLRVECYAEMLFACGFTDLNVFEKVYPQMLHDADAVVEFTRGTLLIPYLERLPADLGAAFVEAFRARVRALMPGSPILYAFNRILFTATRPV